MRSVLRDKLRAGGMHFALSVVLGSAILAIFVLVWYQPPLFAAAGASRLLVTILCVDVALGPLLTFAVFRRGKRGLRMDLTLIAAAQLAALGYGLHVAFVSRPAFIAVLPMRATLVRANDLYPESAKESTDVPLWGPRYVAVVDPATHAEREAVLMEVLDGKPDLDFRPLYYRPLPPHLRRIIAAADSLDRLMADYPHTRRYYELWARERGYSNTHNLRYVPLVTSGDELELVFDDELNSIVGIAEFPKS